MAIEMPLESDEDEESGALKDEGAGGDPASRPVHPTTWLLA